MNPSQSCGEKNSFFLSFFQIYESSSSAQLVADCFWASPDFLWLSPLMWFSTRDLRPPNTSPTKTAIKLDLIHSEHRNEATLNIFFFTFIVLWQSMEVKPVLGNFNLKEWPSVVVPTLDLLCYSISQPAHGVIYSEEKQNKQQRDEKQTRKR